ncbi:hypothetical protein Pmani_031418 [Petrolisthes manimaculis]|uniref:Translocator protein n=1 Tax=Petrolisthes manimaculis TaxID=1843537 RepID=A0AAE1TSN4_9EUCA|nr:hypothetical protein Pmani_031418 [Petrolisthes manimaculis]
MLLHRLIMAWWHAVIAVLLPNIGGVLGAYFTRNSIPKWYNKQLRKPNWRPPNWTFGPVWTFLYCTMGYASYRVWTELGYPSLLGSPFHLPYPLNAFLLQLVMNWLWTPMFFGMKNITLALVEMVMLDAVVVLTMLRFFEVDSVAGLLFVPYVIWLSLATCLTISIWRANPKWRYGDPSKGH